MEKQVKRIVRDIPQHWVGDGFPVRSLFSYAEGSEKAAPKYQDILAADIPSLSLPTDAGTARVIAGELLDTKGPASTFTPINVWDLQLKATGSATLTVPTGHTSLLVVQSGSVIVNDAAAQAVELVLFDREGTSVTLEAQTASRILLLSGAPIGDSIVGQGPFVMNSRKEIQEAIRDYPAGKMGRLDK